MSLRSNEHFEIRAHDTRHAAQTSHLGDLRDAESLSAVSLSKRIHRDIDDALNDVESGPVRSV
jgi:hypothetical protein